VRGLQKAGHEVRVAMTANSEHFVGPATLAALTKHPVLDDLFSRQRSAEIAHIELADWSQLAVVVPADANVIAKMAQGLADDAVSTTLLALHCPRLIVPAMNTHMWANPAVQRNSALLKSAGDQVLEPAEGLLAEGYAGKGRMPEPEEIVSWILQQLDQPAKGRRIVVTAGGTLEAIDPVRFIGNRSSGKMGFRLAQAAAERGAEVDLIYGNVSVPVPQSSRIHPHRALSTLEMLEQLQQLFPKADALLMAAAVSDWRPKKAADHKLKKQKGVEELSLDLVKNPDLLKTVAKSKQAGQVVIGFAAETNDLLENAGRKLAEKGADIIVANDVSGDAFGGDEDQVTILEQGRELDPWPRMTKQAVAGRLIDLALDRLNERQQ
ncbi:bifunctional phosphopantothenoylcysteine decarboxylase/phosphopantothenate--cysteine ligase CoaBC, partial [Lactobacillus nasalidis]|uniref:bifunctional phosphopantothenoylcysteine decarboxylase/phosphopantothenate--cysteine ligase CoaBC n=1 Tax=Lactobacillus nasalidis TaxID=2797258 RepID=UPI001916C54A